MRRVMMTLAVIGALAVTIAVGPSASGAAEHPGCNGIDQAYSKASAKGKEALTVVSTKFGCGTVTPEIDTMACPTGTTSVARYTYLGTKDGPYADGYPTWQGSWTLVSGGTLAWIETTESIYTNGDGFYWQESSPDLVTLIKLGSTTGAVGSISDPATGYPPVHRLNVFTEAEGTINAVNFCAAAA